MPRANVPEHFKLQSRWDSRLLKLPPAVEALSSLKDLVTASRHVPVQALGGLIKVRPELLREQNRDSLTKDGRTGVTLVDEMKAIEIVRGYLPRILGWKPVATVAQELGLHRNQVESIVRLSGPSTNLRLCLDKKLYISPEGEKILSRGKQRRERVQGQELLTDFADRIGVPANNLRAFFSFRKIELAPDLHGRRHLSEEQKAMVLKWRDGVAEKRGHRDLVIDGKPYRSVVKVAEELADTLAFRGTHFHKRFVQRQYGSLRHIARKAGTIVQTDLGLYVPAADAEAFRGTLSKGQAARFVGVSTNTLSRWCRQSPDLRATSAPGREARPFVNIARFLQIAREKYRDEYHFVTRPSVPSILLFQGIQNLVRELEIKPLALLKVFPIDDSERRAVLDTRKKVSRLTFDTLAPILFAETNRSEQIAIPQPLLDVAQKNERKLGLQEGELLSLALSPAIARSSEKLGGTVASSMVHTLVRLSLATSEVFKRSAFVPCRNLRTLTIDWSAREGVPVEKALALTGLSVEDQGRIKGGVGTLSGESTLRLLTLFRLKKEKLIREGVLVPHLDGGNSRSHVPRPKERVVQQKFSGITVNEVEVFRSLLSTAKPQAAEGIGATHRLSAACLTQLITTVAQSRAVPPERVYAFTAAFFKASVRWERSFNALSEARDDTGEGRLYPVRVGEFLLAIEDPRVRVHVYGTSFNAPNVGDLFAHPTLADYGVVLGIEDLEGGKVAVVKLNDQRDILRFRIETSRYSVTSA